MENDTWKDQIPEIDHLHRLHHHALQGDMDKPDKEARKDPRRWFDQKGSVPKHPKE